jgi:hypothetical protein
LFPLSDRKCGRNLQSLTSIIHLLEFYRGIGEEDLVRGYLVFAVDGGKAEVPASAENIKSFGCVGTPENHVARALVNCISDVHISG